MTKYVGRKRWICWPDPDAVCLEGGCGHCVDHELVALSRVAAYARAHGLVEHFVYGALRRAREVRS